MGIRGLTTYINNRSDVYLKYYELHDTFLVIDGNSICLQIYKDSNCNCAFGGDYDNYAQCVSDFFDDLLKCGVTPLVIFDGGYEKRKLHTIIRRVKEKMQTALYFSPQFQQCMKFFPLFILHVFKEVLRKKDIRHVQCLGEADNHIAAVAKVLNCPVLSYDSDFYIYGSLYIPFNTLDNYTVKSSTGKGYMKCCKIYKDEYLLNSHKGLTQSMLPLAATLLSNDYVHWGTFKNFFCHLSIKGVSRKKYNIQQCRIDATFTWLSTYTLDKAIIGILSRVIKPLRPKILNLIETNINNYTNVSADMLIPLGFPKDYVARVNAHHINRTFTFDGDINTLTYIEEVCDEVEEECDIQIPTTFQQSESMSTDVAVNNLPKWFQEAYCMARLSPKFINIMLHNLYIPPIQVEDYSSPSSNIITLKIVSLIYGLLKSGQNSNTHVLRYMSRTQNNKPVWNELEGTDSILSYKFPPLLNLRETPLSIRKCILDNTLHITNIDCIDKLPPKWMLYVGCIKYWSDQQQPSISHKCYLYAMFVCMLFNAIDSKIGRYRKKYNFEKKYGSKIQSIEQKRKEENCEPHCTMNGTIIEAYNQIYYNDCLLAAPFFISHFQMDDKLYSEPKKFNRSAVHAFAEFQACLLHVTELNELLGYPYQRTIIAELYNGTLLYNLSNNFKIRCDIEGYITGVLQKSPSLLRLLNIFLSMVKPMFPLILQINPKKQRSRTRSSKCNKNTSESDDYFSAGEDSFESLFYDENNAFTLLNCE